MSKLKTVLQSSLPDVTSLGGGGRNVNREQLVGLLGDLAGDLGRAYWIRTIVTFLILAMLMIAIWRYGGEPTILSSAGAGIGVTFVGALAALKQVTDELARV